MDFESHSITLKIWDPSTVDHALEAAVAHVSATASAPREHVKVLRSGPGTFTVGLAEDLS